MSKKLLIDAAFSDETRVALIDENNVLENIDRETPSIKQLKGNIYLAKIIRLEPSLQSAFINYGGDRHGFLPFSDIHPDYYNIPENRKTDLTAVKFFNELDPEYKLDNSEEEPEEATSEDFEQENFVELDEKNEPIITEELKEEINSTTQTFEENVQFSTVELDDDSDSKEENQEQLSEKENCACDKDDDTEGECYHTEYKRNKIEDVLKEGQYLLVQVLKEERGNKGVALTTYISLAGKYSVLMANVEGKGGISKKITNLRDRKILKNILNTINPNNDKSIIIRTAGVGKKPEDIFRDYVYLTRLWKAIKQVSLESFAPAFIHSEDDILKRAIRDLFNDGVNEILVEGNEAYKTIKSLATLIAPEQKTVIKEYTEKVPLFYKAGIEEQVLQLYNNKVILPSGGSIVIDQTEALVTIDVNSGKSTKQSSVEEMAVATNIEAAKEIARQLRLRDIGGLIVIDFIDMFEFKNRRLIERTMRDTTATDKAKIQIDKISMFGLLEMSRQRLNASFGEKVSEKCPNCEGRGMVKSKYIVAENILRNVKYCARDKNYQVFSISTSEDMMEYLLNYKRDELKKIEQEYEINIFISSDKDKNNHDYEIKRREKLTDFEKMDLYPATANKGKVNEMFDDSDLYDDFEDELNKIRFSDECYYNKNTKSEKVQRNRYDSDKKNTQNKKQQVKKNNNNDNKNKNKKVSFFGRIKSLFNK